MSRLTNVLQLFRETLSYGGKKNTRDDANSYFG